MVVDKKPKYRADLKTLGHTSNRFYLVMGSKFIESIYCDLTTLLNEQG
jgi:hypothetical protein